MYHSRVVPLQHLESSLITIWKSGLMRYGKARRDIPSEHLYTHFYSYNHHGLSDLSVTIIDKANPNEPTTREGFWTYKLNSFTPRGFNQRDFF